MNQIRNMDMDCYTLQERQSRRAETLKNTFALTCVFCGFVFFFNIPSVAIIMMAVTFIAMAILRVDYAIGVIITYWFLVPADMINFMFISSGVGNFPVYVLLIPLFIIGAIIQKRAVKRASDRLKLPVGTFHIYLSFILVIFCLIISYIVYSEGTIISNSVKFLFQTLGMFVLIKLKNFDRNDINNIYKYIFFLVIIEDLIAMAEHGFGFNIYDIYGATKTSEWYEYVMKTSGIWRIKATFGNSLIFSSTLALCLPVIEYLRKTYSKIWLDILGIFALAFGSVLSGSRSGTAIIAIYIIFYFFTSKAKKKILFLCLIPITILLFINYVDYSLILQRSQNITNTNSFTHRMAAYETYFSAIILSPIWGVGLGNTYNILNKFIGGSFEINTFDNAFMDLTLAIGILGFFAILVVIRELVQMTSQKEGRYLLKFSVVVMVLISLFLNTTKYQSLWGMFWLHLFLFSDATKKMDETNQEST